MGAESTWETSGLCFVFRSARDFLRSPLKNNILYHRVKKRSDRNISRGIVGCKNNASETSDMIVSF